MHCFPEILDYELFLCTELFQVFSSTGSCGFAGKLDFEERIPNIVLHRLHGSLYSEETHTKTPNKREE